MPLSCDRRFTKVLKNPQRLCDVILLNKQAHFMDIQGENYLTKPLNHSHQVTVFFILSFVWVSSLFSLASGLRLCSCVLYGHVGITCCLDNILLSNPCLSEPHIWHGQFTSFSMRHWPHTKSSLHQAMKISCVCLLTLK